MKSYKNFDNVFNKFIVSDKTSSLPFVYKCKEYKEKLFQSEVLFLFL
jgi:hypothetical protein